ncbi:MAG: methyltransferase domain-containing protein, partial [Candidatus Electrothrix sp. AR4]|nr:methyltransferase domain-containing protein [Candidatus Electrothrix sp. AR4]
HLHRTMENTGHEDHVWGYIFKEIYPYFMRSRFAERSYFKPKGYAGDFLMMEHIYNNSPAGDGRFGEIIDAFCLDRQGSHAVRGRRILLREQLATLSRPLAEAGKKINIMNLACGSNRELFDFIMGCEYSTAIDALCVDIDPDALQYTNSQVNVFPHGASVRLMQENVIKWSLGRAQQEFPQQDIIYSAGLCDYLNRRLFKSLVEQCHRHLKPGGFLMLGNFTWYPDVLFSSKFLKWELIYRTQDDLLELFDGMHFSSVQVLSEENNINLFVLAQKD